MFARVLAFAVSLAVAGTAASIAAPGSSGSDPFLWLEAVNGPRAMAWVKAENAKTLAVLKRDPHFARFYADALKINEAPDRIPAPELIDGRIYNFWQDATHVRGIWRRTTAADYASAAPHWTTVLDLDAQAKADGKNWVWHGADCDSPSRTRCLITLSEGGEDASTVREFDLAAGGFVPGGFTLPHSKQNTAWVDDDTILISREWAPGDLTASGYPYIVKRLKRGQPLASATEIFRGTKTDVWTNPSEVSDGQGNRVVYINRGLSFFENEVHLVTPDGTPKLAIPLKATPAALLDGRLLVRLDDAWQTGGATYAQGSLVALDQAAAMRDPANLQPATVYAPGPRETLSDVATTRDRLIVTTLENVKGRAFVYAPESGGAWTRKQLQLPDNSTVAAGSADNHGSSAFIEVTSFLTPASFWLADADAGTVTAVKRGVPRFDSSNDVVEQREATSKDGTKIPYFIVHRKGMTYDGSNPTLLYAYGGFSVSMTPTYSGVEGKLWLERGGVFVLANIRGGGEFGPAWHDAGLTTHRQRIYDDFAAVGRDLIATKVTSPRRLGIQGGSNGGLLMGVEFTQHPELWHAVDIQVPLLDMLRFEHIAAGASWVGEYGSVSKPDERGFLASISPYNNLRAGVAYPQPLIWTTTKDDRVGPQHARKFAAKLAAMHVPYYFYEVTEGGHGAGANIRESSFTSALELTYFTRKLMQ